MTRPDAVRRPSPATLATVRASLVAVAEHPVELAEVFYDELFAMEPRLRAMFPTDMTDQMQKMTAALVGAISALDTDDVAQLERTLHLLGAAHATHYGVEEWHYTYVGHALTRAVRDVAGPAYSGAMSSSWIALYQWVAAQMVAGASAAERGEPVADVESTTPVAPVVPREQPLVAEPAAAETVAAEPVVGVPEQTPRTAGGVPAPRRTAEAAAVADRARTR